MTWLTNVAQAGYTLTMQGRCLTLTSLSDYIGNLEGSRYFIRPVDIVESAVVAGDGKTTPDLIAFTIRGTFQMAGIDSVAPPLPTTEVEEEGGQAWLILSRTALNKLPWYGQIGVFVALSAIVAGVFYYYYETPAQAADGRAPHRA